MLGHEVLGKVIGYAVGVLGVIAVLLMKDAYNRKKRKERRELEREYRALGLLGDD